MGAIQGVSTHMVYVLSHRVGEVTGTEHTTGDRRVSYSPGNVEAAVGRLISQRRVITDLRKSTSVANVRSTERVCFEQLVRSCQYHLRSCVEDGLFGNVYPMLVALK